MDGEAVYSRRQCEEPTLGIELDTSGWQQAESCGIYNGGRREIAMTIVAEIVSRGSGGTKATCVQSRKYLWYPSLALGL